MLEMLPRRSGSLRINFSEQPPVSLKLRRTCADESLIVHLPPHAKRLPGSNELRTGHYLEALGYGLLWISASGVIALSFF